MSERRAIPPVFDTAPGPHTMRIEGSLGDPQAEFSHQQFNTDTQSFEKVEAPISLGGVATSHIAEVLESGPPKAEPIVPPTPEVATGDLGRDFLAGIVAEADEEAAIARQAEENRKAVQAEISAAQTVKTGADYLAGIIADADLAEQALESHSRKEFVPHSGDVESDTEPGTVPSAELQAAEPVEAIPDAPYLRQQLNEQTFVHPAMPDEVRRAGKAVRRNWLVNQGIMNKDGEFIEPDDAAQGRPANAGQRLRRQE